MGRVNSIRCRTLFKRCCFVVGLTLLSLSAGADEVWQEAEAGQMYIRRSADQPWQQSVHLQSHVQVAITGMVVQTTYQQSFKNSSNQWQEAIYVFPLGEQAAVHYLSMKVGEREIVGQIKEKNQAEKIYQQAKRDGKKAALLDQQRPNLFTQKVANIAPGETIRVTLKYVENARYDAGHFSWRLPTTLTPRYMPGDILLSQEQQNPLANVLNEKKETVEINSFGWALPTTHVNDAHLISPFMRPASTPAEENNPLTLSVALSAGIPLAEISALYHELQIEKKGAVHNISLQDGAVEMDRDFVLHWQPLSSNAPAAAVFKEQHEGEDYVMLMLMPPTTQSSEKLARDVVFILDTSGSMEGESIRQAKPALARAIRQLNPADRFNVIEFNNGFRRLFEQLRNAEVSVCEQALQWVDNLAAGGGTEMLPALQQAFKDLSEEGLNLKQIVFITDGAVGNEQQLFQSIQQQLGESRLFTVGIGSAPNSYFMHKAAQFGRGTFTYIGSGAEVTAGMDTLFNKLSSAAASKIQAAWPFPVEQYPEKVPDLYLSEPLLLFAKISAVNGELMLTGQTASASLSSPLQSWQQSVDLNGLSEMPKSAGIARLWARQKIENLEDQKIAGRDALEVREEVLSLALSNQIVTAYTSFVAVEQEISRPQSETLAFSSVPNLVAKGQVLLPGTGIHRQSGTAQSIAYPATSTSLSLSILIALLASAALALMIGLVREQKREVA